MKHEENLKISENNQIEIGAFLSCTYIYPARFQEKQVLNYESLIINEHGCIF